VHLLQYTGGLIVVCAIHTLQALGFLNLLMPTHAIAAREGDWATWVPTWLDLQEGVAHCRWWDATWMDLISRVSKHDKHGAKACTSGGSGPHRNHLLGAGSPGHRDHHHPCRQPGYCGSHRNCELTAGFPSGLALRASKLLLPCCSIFGPMDAC